MKRLAKQLDEIEKLSEEFDDIAFYNHRKSISLPTASSISATVFSEAPRSRGGSGPLQIRALTAKEQTERILRAMDNKDVPILLTRLAVYGVSVQHTRWTSNA